MDSSYSSKARIWHFLHLEEAGKTFAAIGQKRDAEHEKFKVKD